MSAKQAVIVIDMLNDFLYGKLKCERCQKIIPELKKLLQTAREKNIAVIYLCDAHSKDDEEFNKWPQHAVKGSHGAEVIDELKPLKRDHVIKKTRYSCFFNTELENLLEKLEIKHLILCGILTDICVQHTAADAYYRNLKVSVPIECTEALSEDAKKESLEFMKAMYGAEILEVEYLSRHVL